MNRLWRAIYKRAANSGKPNVLKTNLTVVIQLIIGLYLAHKIDVFEKKYLLFSSLFAEL